MAGGGTTAPGDTTIRHAAVEPTGHCMDLRKTGQGTDRKSSRRASRWSHGGPLPCTAPPGGARPARPPSAAGALAWSLVVAMVMALPTGSAVTTGATAPPPETLWSSQDAGLGDVIGHAWSGDAIALLERTEGTVRLWRAELPDLAPRPLLEAPSLRHLAAAGDALVVADGDSVRVLALDGTVRWNVSAQAPRGLVAQGATAAWLEDRDALHVMRLDLGSGALHQATATAGPRSLPSVNDRYIVWEESPPQTLGAVQDLLGPATPGADHPSTYDLWMYHHDARNVFPLDQRPFAQRFPALDLGTRAVYISEDGGPDADILLDDVADPRAPDVLAADVTNPVMLHFDGERVVAVTGFGRESLLQRWDADGSHLDAVPVGDSLDLSTHGGIAATRQVGEQAIRLTLLRLPFDDDLTIAAAPGGGGACWNVTGSADRVWVESADVRVAQALPATVCDATGVRAWTGSGLGPLRGPDETPAERTPAVAWPGAAVAALAAAAQHRLRPGADNK